MTYTHQQVVHLFSLCREFGACPIVVDGDERFYLPAHTEPEVAEAFAAGYHAIIGSKYAKPKVKFDAEGEA